MLYYISFKSTLPLPIFISVFFPSPSILSILSIFVPFSFAIPSSLSTHTSFFLPFSFFPYRYISPITFPLYPFPSFLPFSLPLPIPYYIPLLSPISSYPSLYIPEHNVPEITRRPAVAESLVSWVRRWTVRHL